MRDKEMLIIHITKLKGDYYEVYTDYRYKTKRKDILKQIGKWIDERLR